MEHTVHWGREDMIKGYEATGYFALMVRRPREMNADAQSAFFSSVKPCCKYPSVHPQEVSFLSNFMSIEVDNEI